MAYCTAANIEAEFKEMTFSTSTTPTLEAVEGWIDEESAQMDMYLMNRYTTPVTGDASDRWMLILRKICIFRVVARVKREKGLASSTKVTDQTRNVDSRLKEVETLESAIRDGSLGLPGLAMAFNPISSSGAVKNCVESVFKDFKP